MFADALSKAPTTKSPAGLMLGFSDVVEPVPVTAPSDSIATAPDDSPMVTRHQVLLVSVFAGARVTLLVAAAMKLQPKKKRTRSLRDYPVRVREAKENTPTLRMGYFLWWTLPGKTGTVYSLIFEL